MRAAVYLRISEDKLGDELGVTRQRADCCRLAERRDWQVVRVYVDNDVSATNGSPRPEWEAMMKDIEAGLIDVVIGWTIDRTLRSGRDRLRMLESGKTHGITIALVRGSDMDLGTPSGRLAADILGAVALAEVEMKADRQKRAGKQRAEAGLPWGPRRPFGYEQGGMVLHPVESSLLKQAYTDVLSGASLRGIASAWNTAGVTTSQGKQWRAEQLGPVLLNPRNGGLRAYDGDIIGKAAWPGIVDEVTWRATHVLLTNTDRRVGEVRARKHLLTGLVVCGKCGRPMGSGMATSTGRAVYRCRPSQHLSREAGPVDELVRDVLAARLSRADAAELTRRDESVDVAALHTEAGELRARLESVAVDFADGTLTPKQVKTINDRVKGRLRAVEKRIVDSMRVSALSRVIGASNVAATFDAAPLDARREIVAALVTVTILPARGGSGFRPDAVRIEWR